jgi:hypothetical protein
MTGNDGYYYIIGIKEGEYKVKCIFEGLYTSSDSYVKIRGRLTSTVNFRMYPYKVILSNISHERNIKEEK